MRGRRFEFWELVNAAWAKDKGVRLMPKSKIKWASLRIRYDMIEYIRDETEIRRRIQCLTRGKPLPWMFNFSVLNETLADGRKFEDIMENPHAEVPNLEQKDIVNYLLNHSGLARDEKLAMKLHYLDGFTQKETGRIIGITASRVSQLVRDARMMIKNGMRSKGSTHPVTT
jgi:RNA polymerase sigma factor (sigma-70 family)